MYRRLPGWRTTPPGVPTDLHMWQQFLVRSDCRAVSGSRPTAITFPSPPRLHWTVAERLSELAHWARRLEDEAGRRAVMLEILEAAYRACLVDVARLQELYGSPLWRARRAVASVPGFQLLKRAFGPVARGRISPPGARAAEGTPDPGR